jgi:hypothetical protein
MSSVARSERDVFRGLRWGGELTAGELHNVLARLGPSSVGSGGARGDALAHPSARNRFEDREEQDQDRLVQAWREVHDQCPFALYGAWVAIDSSASRIKVLRTTRGEALPRQAPFSTMRSPSRAAARGANSRVTARRTSANEGARVSCAERPFVPTNSVSGAVGSIVMTLGAARETGGLADPRVPSVGECPCSNAPRI